MLEAITQAGYKPGAQIGVALDPAASEFYDKSTGNYVFKKSDKSAHSPEQMVEYWSKWIEKYPSFRSRTAWEKKTGPAEKLTEKLGSKNSSKKIQLVGDDLFVTNTERLAQGINRRHCQLHPDQTKPDRHVTETIDAIKMAPQRRL